MHCLPAINFKYVVIIKNIIDIFGPLKLSNVFTYWWTWRNKVQGSDSPSFLFRTKNLYKDGISDSVIYNIQDKRYRVVV